MKSRPSPTTMNPWLLVIVLVPVLWACRGDFDPGDQGMIIELGLSPTPPTVGPARLIITLQDTAGIPLENASVEVEGTMSHAGMVPVLATATAEAPGRYVVPAFSFTMAGDWTLEVQATLSDGRQARHRMPAHVIGAPSGMGSDSGVGHEGAHPPGGQH